MYVGTIERRKNLGRVIQAFLKSGLARDGYRLKVVGGEGFGAAQELKDACPSFMDRLGPVDNEELRRLYQGATGFLFPSLYEGFGLPILEAMSLGAPVITSRLGACAEIAGEAALLVDPTDPEHLAQAMETLAMNPGAASWFRARGYERVKRYQWSQAAARTATVYRDAFQAWRTSSAEGLVRGAPPRRVSARGSAIL